MVDVDWLVLNALNFISKERFGLDDIEERKLKLDTTLGRGREELGDVILQEIWGKQSKTPYPPQKKVTL